MATLLVRFTGVMVHYNPTIDPDAPPGLEGIQKRVIVPDLSKSHHPHEVYLEMTEGAAMNPQDFPAKLFCYTRAGVKRQRFTLDQIGVRLTISSRDRALVIDPTFSQFVPSLGQVCHRFGPILPEYLKFDPCMPDKVAAHFDIKGGKLRAVAYDPFPTRFEPPYQWPPNHPGTPLVLANAVELELDVDNGNGREPIEVIAHFYKRNETHSLLLRPNTLQITLGNLVHEEVIGANNPDRQRDHHFRFYYDLQSRKPKVLPVPRIPGIGNPRGSGGGGCPNGNYPP